MLYCRSLHQTPKKRDFFFFRLFLQPKSCTLVLLVRCLLIKCANETKKKRKSDAHKIEHRIVNNCEQNTVDVLYRLISVIYLKICEKNALMPKLSQTYRHKKENYFLCDTMCAIQSDTCTHTTTRCHAYDSYVRSSNFLTWNVAVSVLFFLSLFRCWCSSR